MKESTKLAVRQILENYLNENHHRKTPERFAVLDAVYGFPAHFTMQQLSEQLDATNFHVSRSTLYNTINLFLKLHLVACHRLSGSTMYEACYDNAHHCHQICTVCGQVTSVRSQQLTDAVEQIRLKRFRKESFALYIYGTCSSCQAKITRHKNKRNDKC